MSEFPTDLERKVASSLLLLSTDPVLSSPSRSGSEKKSVEKSKRNCHDSLSLSLVSTGSRSCGSSLSSDGSSQKSNDRGFKINSMDVTYHLFKLKPVKKRRSKVFWSSINLKNPVFDLSICSDDSKEESCLSSKWRNK
ncbi:PREDICTED: uncharacterized protein LOC104824305 [Tarenaya hassleriana]|uniref:uncharacterized protein LOC104824305 n=1 Tax=Tarenaya hassleriana TaxID=28532 RepID=UPI0008FD5C59|nr:PREDICTED: uncharacterized protein LOC104824305 [Tarenaya hassleriana]